MQTTGAPLTIQRISTIATDTPGTVGGDNNRAGLIRVTNSGASIDPDELIVHELSHNWDTGFQILFFSALSDWKIVELTVFDVNANKYLVPAGYTQASTFGKANSWTSGGKTYAWVYRSNAEFARPDGYGRSNPYEDFASTVETFYVLAKTGVGKAGADTWLSKWNYVNDWLKTIK